MCILDGNWITVKLLARHSDGVLLDRIPTERPDSQKNDVIDRATEISLVVSLDFEDWYLDRPSA